MYKCENHCPKCNSLNIEWGIKDVQDDSIYQGGICEDCDCMFTEIFTYSHTEIDSK